MRYDQLVVAPGLAYEDEYDKKDFLNIFKKHGFKRPKIVGVIETLPSKDENGNVIPGTGGRKDFFFFINNKDINKFAVWRMSYGMRWWEDVFYNNEQDIYPEEFRQQYPKRW